MTTGVYNITNKTNGKTYVGSSCDIELRQKNHFRDLRNNRHHNKAMQKDFNKHGEENFIFSIVIICEESKLMEEENKMLKNVFSTKRNYNQMKKATSLKFPGVPKSILYALAVRWGKDHRTIRMWFLLQHPMLEHPDSIAIINGNKTKAIA